MECHVIPTLKQKRKFIKTIFQQNGATPHTAITTRRFLSKKIGESRIISQGFPFAWPEYSPDLNLANYGL